MTKVFILSMTVALLSASANAKQDSGINAIFDELSTYTPGAAEPAETAPAPSADAAAPAARAVIVSKPARVASTVSTAAPVSVTVADMPDGFQQAQKGFDQLAEAEPESQLTRIVEERDHTRVRTAGIKAVDEAWSTELVCRSYQLAPDAIGKMELGAIEKSKDISSIFTPVDFPKGASAVFQSEMGALFVRNTRENLEVLESILHALNLTGFSSDTDQVEIEAKFVEVSEGTLEELGFQWNFENAVNLGDGITADDGSGGLFSSALRGTANNSSLPFSSNVDMGNGQISASGDWSSFSLADSFSEVADTVTLNYAGHNPLNVIISALDQSSGADVLSAPRIVTRSGEKALIQVGELHSYPEVFEGDSGQGAMVNVSYQDFADTLLGVELSVTPQVDGDQITMRLNPRITELAGWQTYLLATTNSIYNYRQEDIGNEYEHDPVVGKIPIFKKREIECEVTIADGSTIGMGGLISEQTEAFEDKVPLLGSLPLVGRLFRSEGEQTIKRNLLMFVTAKKVDPSGRIVSTINAAE